MAQISAQSVANILFHKNISTVTPAPSRLGQVWQAVSHIPVLSSIAKSMAPEENSVREAIGKLRDLGFSDAHCRHFRNGLASHVEDAIRLGTVMKALRDGMATIGRIDRSDRYYLGVRVDGMSVPDYIGEEHSGQLYSLFLEDLMEGAKISPVLLRTGPSVIRHDM